MLNSLYLGHLETIGGPDGHFQLGDGLGQKGLAPDLILGDLLLDGLIDGRGLLVAKLKVLDKRIQMLADNLAAFNQSQLGRNSAVSPDFQLEPIIVGALAKTGVLGGITDALDGRENGIDRDNTCLLFDGGVLGGRTITPSATDLHGHIEADTILGQRGNDLIGLKNLDSGVGHDHSGSERALLVSGKLEDLRLVGVRLEHHGLDVQNDVRNVLDNTGDAAELVGNSVDFDPGYGAALNTAEQDPAQRVADRDAKAAFKRLDHKQTILVRGRSGVQTGSGGKFQASPSNLHTEASNLKGITSNKAQQSDAPRQVSERHREWA